MLGLIISLQFQLLAMLILLTVLILYALREGRELEKNKIFIRVPQCALASCVLDALSVLCIRFMPTEGRGLIVEDLVRRTYLLSVVIVSYYLLSFVMLEIYGQKLYKKGWRFSFVIPMAASVPFIFSMPINVKDSGIYSFGGAVYTSMLVTVIYLLLTLILVVRKRESLSGKERLAIVGSLLIVWLCGIIQLFVQNYRLMSLGMAILSVQMYICLERPELNRNTTLGIYNEKALRRYLENRLNKGKTTSLVYVFLSDYPYIYSYAGEKNALKLVKELVDFLGNADPSIHVFSYASGGFMVAYERDDHFVDYLRRLRERGNSPWIIELGEQAAEFEMVPHIVAYPKDKMPSDADADELLSTLKTYSVLQGKNREKFTCIDSKELAECDFFRNIKENIHNVIAEDRLEVFYQPVYSVKDNRCVEIEALLRIRDSRGIYMDNRQVIAEAERSGELIGLGYEVFRRVCSFIRDSKPDQLGIRCVDFNLSTIQCQQRDFARRLVDIMNEYQVSPAIFRFEITEAASCHIGSNFERNINVLTGAGAEFIIGNYGEKGLDPDGAAAFNSEYIKVSPQVVGEYFAGEKRLYLKNLLQMLHQQKMTVVAVGVENQGQYLELKKMGFTHMQGNAFYPPMRGEELLAAIADENAMMLGREVMYERIL